MYKELRIGLGREVMLNVTLDLMANGSVKASDFAFKTCGSLRLALVIRIIKTRLDETQTLDFKITFASWIQLIIIWLFFSHSRKAKDMDTQFNQFTLVYRGYHVCNPQLSCVDTLRKMIIMWRPVRVSGAFVACFIHL